MLPLKASPEGWADMKSRTKLLAYAVAVCAMLAVLSSQGCSPAGRDLPASSIQSGLPQDGPALGQGVKHQPTVLRAEAADPPISPVLSDRLVSESGSDSQPSELTAPATPSPHIADLLPVTSLDAPPNQR